MGISQLALLSFHSDGIQRNEETSHSNGSLWSKLLEAKAKRRLKAQKQRKGTRSRSIIMKRRAVGECSRRLVVSPIIKKVKTLKKLIPNNGSMGLDGLFRDTAEYILSLQMRIKVMQIMVNVLTDSDE